VPPSVSVAVPASALKTNWSYSPGPVPPISKNAVAFSASVTLPLMVRVSGELPVSFCPVNSMSVVPSMVSAAMVAAVPMVIVLLAPGLSPLTVRVSPVRRVMLASSRASAQPVAVHSRLRFLSLAVLTWSCLSVLASQARRRQGSQRQ
jgi:hypothetical protein